VGGRRGEEEGIPVREGLSVGGSIAIVSV